MPNNNFTFNWPLVGNSHITDHLSKSIAAGNIAGSYIFCGPDDLGKSTAANYFTKALLCGNNAKGAGKLPCGECPACRQAEKGLHGDLHIIEKDKEKKNISIELIRDFVRVLGMASFLNTYKIGIIKNAESLSIEAANALLKTLEEPKAKVAVILTVSHIGSLPETIVSRSQIMRFKPVKADIIYDYLIASHQVKRSLAKDLSRLCLGRPALAVKFLENKDFYGEYINQAGVFLRFFSQDINERLSAVESLIGARASGQESVKSAAEIIDVWQGLARDLLFLRHGQENLIQHLLLREELEKIKLRTGALLGLIEIFEQAKQYLSANVNPKLALDNIAASI